MIEKEPMTYFGVFKTIYRIVKKSSVQRFIIFMVIRQFGGGLGGGPFYAFLISNVILKTYLEFSNG